LERTHVLEAKLIGRPTVKLGEPLDRVDVGSLRCRRQVAQAHVVDHTTTQRAYRCRGASHGMVSWLRVGPATKPSHQEAIPANTHTLPRQRVSSILKLHFCQSSVRSTGQRARGASGSIAGKTTSFCPQGRRQNRSHGGTGQRDPVKSPEPGATLEVAKQIGIPCSPHSMMLRSCVDRRKKRVIHGNDHGDNHLSEQTA
jgi:hypothetical protein